MKNNIIHCISGLLKGLKIKYDASNLKKEVLMHPFYNSLEGITDVLNNYKVKNIAFRATLEQLHAVETPVLVHLNERNGIFAILHSIGNEDVVLSFDEKGKKRHPLSVFKDLWSGITVLAEPNEQSGEPVASNVTKSNIPKIAYGAIVACLVLLLGLTGYQNSSIFFVALLVAKLIGIGFVALLASHELSIDTALTDKLCTLTKSTGCNEVLKSKASSLFGIVKLADVGLVYFISTTLALIVSGIGGIAADMLQMLSWLSVLSLPFILYSVSYQLAVVKKWCPFCMGVAATLTAEAVLAFAIGNLELALPSFTSITLIVFCALIVSSIWMALKPVLKEKKRLERFEFLYTRLKRKPEVIKGVLAESDYTEIPMLEGELILGNPNAPFTITEVVAPYCGPCARSFDKLNELLKEAEDRIKVQLRFLANKNRDEQATVVVAHMLALAERLSPEELRYALESWFKEHDYKKWIKAYPANADEHIFLRLEAQLEWAKGLGINATPTIYVNGYRWKLDMDLYDLKYSL